MTHDHPEAVEYAALAAALELDGAAPPSAPYIVRDPEVTLSKRGRELLDQVNAPVTLTEDPQP